MKPVPVAEFGLLVKVTTPFTTESVSQAIRAIDEDEDLRKALTEMAEVIIEQFGERGIEVTLCEL